MKKLIVSVFVVALVLSCALESKFALANDEEIDQKLLGTWEFLEKKKDTVDNSISIKVKGERKYSIGLSDGAEAVFYTTTIKGHHLLNVTIEPDKDAKNAFYGYEIINDTLIYYEVSDKLRKKDFNSQAALLDFFYKNIEKPNFFGVATTLVRK